jgi:hypothetical protein
VAGPFFKNLPAMRLITEQRVKPADLRFDVNATLPDISPFSESINSVLLAF